MLKRVDVLPQIYTAMTGLWGKTTDDKKNAHISIGLITVTFVRGDNVTNTSNNPALLVYLVGNEIKGKRIEAGASSAGGFGILIMDNT